MEFRISKKSIAIVTMALLGILVIVIFGKNAPTPSATAVLDGEATVITVKSGYRPKEVILKANTQNVIRFVTNNTYDCSASLAIRELNIEKFLPATGQTDIVIPAQPAGKVIYAGCSMGMYSFKMKFL